MTYDGDVERGARRFFGCCVRCAGGCYRQLTMVLGWQTITERPYHKLPPTAPKRDARCIYAVCLAASIISIVILAYVTSYKINNGHFVRHFQLGGVQSAHSGNGTDESSMQIVGFVNKNGDHIRLDSIMGYSPKGVLELRWKKNGSDIKPVGPTVSGISLEGRARLNCVDVNKTSEILSMAPFNFLPNFKNPCWYEPMVRPDVYKTNHFKHFSKYCRNLFKDLTEEWRKKMEQDAQPRRLRCLPYFFIAGQPKCGSTDLYFKLMSHPDVVSPPMKESHWWAKNRFGWRLNFTSKVPINDYIDLYDKAALFMEHVNDPNTSEEQEGYHQLITGDASVSTLWFNDYWWQLPENCGFTEPKYTNAHYIRYLIPKAKIIIILRDPTERLYSDYLYFQKHRKSPDDFHREVLMAISSHERCVNKTTIRSCINNRTIANTARVRLRIGMYYVYLQEWLRVFPRHQLHIVRLEDYADEPMDILKGIFKFLTLRALTSDEEESIFRKPMVANARRSKDKDLGVMREDTREILNNFYMPFNQKLSILLHDPKYLWTPS
ncbi:carbohydrate sulfotransferase 15-like isoform X1 [Haliotis cracherodii]|uniref:carbohydrate sulfotransferase 15-like isoform X1 n=2 Tax=Haliotis cracherodii TaxID=6455 RepID=UPI0039ED8994